MKIRIGTRKSRLALIQTELVKEKIEQAFPEAEIELVKLSTKGDELLDRSLTSFGGKGVFTRELEEALLSGEIDLAVHSAKDMPMEFPPGLKIGAVLERADVRDVKRYKSGGFAGRKRSGHQLSAPGASDQGRQSDSAHRSPPGKCRNPPSKAKRGTV